MPNPALVQHKIVSFGAVSSVNAQFNSPTVVGNRCLVGTAAFPVTATVSSVTDNGTTPNSYNADASTTNGTVGDIVDAHSANIATNPGSGNLQVTVTLAVLASGGNVHIQEVSNLSTALNAVDVSGTAAHTANDVTSAAISSSGSSAAANEYCFGLLGWESNGSNPVGASGTTIDDFDNTNGSVSMHKLSAGGGVETVNLTWTNVSGYIALIVVYKQPAAAAGLPPPAPRRERWRLRSLARRPITFVPAQATAPVAPAYPPGAPRRRALLPALRRARAPAIPSAGADLVMPPPRRRPLQLARRARVAQPPPPPPGADYVPGSTRRRSPMPPRRRPGASPGLPGPDAPPAGALSRRRLGVGWWRRRAAALPLPQATAPGNPDFVDWQHRRSLPRFWARMPRARFWSPPWIGAAPSTAPVVLADPIRRRHTPIRWYRWAWSLLSEYLDE